MKLTTRLSTPWGWKAEFALLADLQRTVYPYKWLPISCRSGAGQWKFANQRPTFYHWATQSTKSTHTDILRVRGKVWNLYSSTVRVCLPRYLFISVDFWLKMFNSNNLALHVLAIVAKQYYWHTWEIPLVDRQLNLVSASEYLVKEYFFNHFSVVIVRR